MLKLHAVLSFLLSVISLNKMEILVRPDNAFMTLSLILSLFAIVSYILINQFNPKYFPELLISSVFFKKSIKVFEAKNTLTIRASYGMTILMIIIFAILLYQKLCYFTNLNNNYNNIQLFLIALAVIIAIVVFKIILYYIIALIINNVENTKEYISNIGIYYRITSLLLFPIVVINVFASPEIVRILLYVSIVLIIIGFSASIVRGFMVGIKTKFPYVYMFLYFCCLELLPFLIVVKLALKQIN
ncbi:MAG TPA: DUF4271 domain-containing protein [Bacteroidales bacterium]|jgi:hypothetical protein|nr:DUF4271 domain-containing protein [Bacteroidales bacterium]MDY0159706.1 DUF4271 domain-containing protein [Bacteroidales bacterium]HXK80635.1 DUF4271 domain-containing protein [Bacteroidales bacterium]